MDNYVRRAVVHKLLITEDACTFESSVIYRDVGKKCCGQMSHPLLYSQQVGKCM